MKWHPFAEQFPMLQGDEWESFKASVNETNGNEQKVYFRKLADGSKQGLDVRNRFRACEQLSIKCNMEEVSLTDTEVIDFITRRNLRRRHLDGPGRQPIVAYLRSQQCAERRIAEVVGRSPSTVHRDLEKVNHEAAGSSNGNATAPNGAVDFVKSKMGKKYKAKRKRKPQIAISSDADESIITDAAGGRPSFFGRRLDRLRTLFPAKTNEPIEKNGT